MIFYHLYMRSLLIIAFAASAMAQASDSRNIVTGSVIPVEAFADQPYIVKTNVAFTITACRSLEATYLLGFHSHQNSFDTP